MFSLFYCEDDCPDLKLQLRDLVELSSFWSLASVIQNKKTLLGFCPRGFSKCRLLLRLLETESHLHASSGGSYLSWRRCFCGFLCTYRFSLYALSPPWRTPKARRLPDSLQFLGTLLWRSHPLCPSRNLSVEISSLSPVSTVFCRVSALLATLHQPLGLISVRTRLPSLPLRAPTAPAHASNSTLQRTYD